jgi:hypothetical protein
VICDYTIKMALISNIGTMLQSDVKRVKDSKIFKLDLLYILLHIIYVVAMQNMHMFKRYWL